MAKLNAKYRCLCILGLIKKICMNLRDDVLALISAVGHSRDKFWLIVFFVVKWSFEGDCSCPEVLPGKIGTAQVFGILISKGGNKETPFGYVCMIYGACTVGDSFDCRKNERRARRG